MTEVAPSLKERFADWIDARTAKGITTYGVPLATNNGRSAEKDAVEEILDFCQYQEQSRLELKERNSAMLAALVATTKDPGLYLRGVTIETRNLIRSAIAKAIGGEEPET